MSLAMILLLHACTNPAVSSCNIAMLIWYYAHMLIHGYAALVLTLSSISIMLLSVHGCTVHAML